MREHPYTLSDEKKKEYAAVLILESIVNAEKKISALLEGDDNLLAPALNELYAKKLVDIKSSVYVATPLGEEKIDQYMKKFEEFLVVYDIYCAVDLEKGEFAFAKFHELDDDQWDVYLNDERWEDLRVTVAEHKKIDPVEIVFMAYINEGYFDMENEGWQFDLMLGDVWNEILEICNSALTAEELGEPDVILDIIHQGSALMIELLEKDKEAHVHDDECDHDEEVTEVTYYQQYSDPYFVSPIWIAPFW
jgi:hypothetical protein